MARTLTRREFTGSMAAAVSALSFGNSIARPQAERPPNIIFIMADDLGYNHLGCYGQEIIRTPHIDRLASQGTRFTQFYAGCTVCAPSRCTLMTGMHQGHCSVRGNSGGIPLRAQDVTVAEVLKQAGYTNGIFGKWGLGDAGTEGVPTRQGFDEFFGYLDQVHAHFYYPDYLWHNEEKFPLPGNQDSQQGQYSHDLIAERALQFIRDNQHGPFFCYVAFTIPHTELLVPEDSLAEYRGQFDETPFPGDHYGAQETPRAAYAAMVTRMDRDVGRILDLLEGLGIANNTVVVFTSDNGGQQSGAGVDLRFFQGNWPLRGWKGLMYEGGIRVPCIARWLGRVQAGAVSNKVWTHWDFLPTAAELAGVQAPSGIDGISAVPALLGEIMPARDYLYWEHHRGGDVQQAVRMGGWKALRHGRNEAIELYYLPTDLGEKFNVAAQTPQQVARAAELFRTARTEPPPQVEPETGSESRYR
ncbi:MAG: arylsulfatase [Acidobacteriota bacterium]